MKDKAVLEALAQRRSVLLGLLFGHLLYYHGKSVTLEDCAAGPQLRLGLSVDKLRAALGSVLAHEQRERVRKSKGGNLAVKVNERSTDGNTNSVEEVQTLELGGGRLRLVCAHGLCFVRFGTAGSKECYWSLWANNIRDHSQFLTSCGGGASEVAEYFRL